MAEKGFDPDEVAQFENATWSRCAASYMGGFGALVAEAIEPLFEEVKLTGNDRLLDVGTGPGLVAAAAAKRCLKVIGIDFSEAMLAQARTLYPATKFQRNQAESLPFEAASFDVVVGNFVLHHSGRPDELLRESYRVLDRNGRAGYTVWADLEKLEAFGLFFAAVEEHAGGADLPHGPLFGVSDLDTFHRMMRNAGFRDSAVRELPLAWRFSSLDSYLAAFRDWANLDAFPKEAVTRIEASVRSKVAAYRAGAQFAIPNPAILVSGVK
jgi:SAM-dependent methyltransferase